MHITPGLSVFGEVVYDQIRPSDYGRWVVYSPGYTKPILGIMTRPSDKEGYVHVDFSKGERVLPTTRLQWGTEDSQSTAAYAHNEAVLAMVRKLRNQDAKLWSLQDAIEEAEKLLWPDTANPRYVGSEIKGKI